jgi:hypothetical protein
MVLKGTGQFIGCVLRRVDNISAFFMKRISVETINHIGKDITLGLTNEQMGGSGELAIVSSLYCTAALLKWVSTSSMAKIKY